MKDVALALRHWLVSNNIPTEGVRIIVDFPSERSACRAEECLKREIESMLTYVHADIEGKAFPMTMCGVGFALTYK